MLIAKQSTARIVTVGPVLDADGVAVTDGVVADFKISKNGGAPAALNGSATLTHRHTGHYSLSLTATDLDTVGSAEITIDDTVNSCGVKEITVVEEAVYDALFLASATGKLPATLATADVSGNLPANVLAVSGSTTAADNLELVFDTDFGSVYSTGINMFNVNTTHLYSTDIGLTVPANLIAFFDGTGYAGGTIPLNANVTAMAANVMTASAAATDMVNEIRDSVVAIFTDDVGTAQAGGASTITLQSGAVATDDYYNGAYVTLTGGTGVGQTRKITGYVGSTKVATLDSNWVTNPDATSTYIVLGRAV